ncbi:AAA family ATPase [Planosporangium thailandense]|uniref:Nuclease SbcCD subunit C n=1 Tax=Planosporangium thailandense TaxID=765197 RepID=A0ABX0XZI6_9ACTN|nr:AAA family ATPase [Planosporangium thailandense]
MNREDPLLDLLFERLAADAVPTGVADTVLAALCGSDNLTAALGRRRPTDERTNPDAPREHIYLSSVTAAGFRGVGPERTLSIRPGPGLTLVVGRNGSGKSSFAEAVELALTGDSARWADKNSVWRTGWRNLHSPHPCRIAVDLRVDGQATPVRVERSWPADADLATAEVAVTGADGHATDLAGLGLAEPLTLYRPFLTAADLGKLVSGTPSELFDAINAILGLDALATADRRLLDAMKPFETSVKEVRARRGPLRDRVAGVDDDRARRAADVLTANQPDLDRLDAILAEPFDGGPDETVALCRRLAGLAIPGRDEVTRLADELGAASAEAQRHDGSRSRALVRTAELLRLALDHHADGGDGPCPVCGAGTLDAAWRPTAEASLADLRVTTLSAQRAVSRLADLTRRARALVDGVTVPDGDAPGVPLDGLRAAVAELRAAPRTANELAAHLHTRYPAVEAAVDAVHTAATDWLRQRDSGWRQVATDIRAWVDAARRVPDQERSLNTLKSARAWLRRAGEELRDDRVAPFAAHSQRIWQELRQESNIRLGAMTLAGTNNRRRVVFPVSVDGVDNGTALGVMSQGEMHALGLATFLPRSCADESPFRFVVIDDPVQSMDPSKVDGLARVLAGLADERQVVVFTHDTRLPDAVRRLEIDADVLEVVRAEQSVVTLRPSLDPVGRYLDDAMAVARSAEVPDDVRAPVVAELCRSALEAACHRVIWRVRLARGDRHADVEDAIERARRRLATTLALALFDDAGRGGDVLGQLNRRYGRAAADAYQACRHGVHGGYSGDLPRLVTDIRGLTGALS